MELNVSLLGNRKSGSYIPQETMEIANEKMPWE